jgi:hypothetical protein
MVGRKNLGDPPGQQFLLVPGFSFRLPTTVLQPPSYCRRYGFGPCGWQRCCSRCAVALLLSQSTNATCEVGTLTGLATLA